MLRIVCWKWEPQGGGLHPRKNIKFTHEHVNRLYAMLDRNLTVPFELICFTDKAEGILPPVKVIPLWDDHRAMGGCYVRLRSFSAEMKELVGEDFFSIDLDVVILQDITELLETTRRHYEFKIWGDTNPTTPYNGSFYYLKAGAREQVWKHFHPQYSVQTARAKCYVGTDQAWIGACLGPHEAKWDTSDGVYSYRVHFQESGGRTALNGDEKIIFFHGSHDPSKNSTQAIVPWVKDHWQ